MFNEKDKFKNKAVKREEENTKLKDDIKSIREFTEEQKKELLESKKRFSTNRFFLYFFLRTYFLGGRFKSSRFCVAAIETTKSFNIELAAVGELGNNTKLLLLFAPID